jgi:hypothetical protein
MVDRGPTNYLSDMTVALLGVEEKLFKGTVYVADVSGNWDMTGVSTPTPELKDPIP